MSHPLRQPIVRELREQGWSVEITRKNHIRATHPDATRPIWLPGTPGSRRNDTRIRLLAKRALGKDTA